MNTAAFDRIIHILRMIPRFIGTHQAYHPGIPVHSEPPDRYPDFLVFIAVIQNDNHLLLSVEAAIGKPLSAAIQKAVRAILQNPVFPANTDQIPVKGD